MSLWFGITTASPATSHILPMYGFYDYRKSSSWKLNPLHSRMHFFKYARTFFWPIGSWRIFFNLFSCGWEGGDADKSLFSKRSYVFSRAAEKIASPISSMQDEKLHHVVRLLSFRIDSSSIVGKAYWIVEGTENVLLTKCWLLYKFWPLL